MPLRQCSAKLHGGGYFRKNFLWSGESLSIIIMWIDKRTSPTRRVEWRMPMVNVSDALVIDTENMLDCRLPRVVVGSAIHGVNTVFIPVAGQLEQNFAVHAGRVTWWEEGNGILHLVVLAARYTNSVHINFMMTYTELPIRRGPPQWPSLWPCILCAHGR